MTHFCRPVITSFLGHGIEESQRLGPDLFFSRARDGMGGLARRAPATRARRIPDCVRRGNVAAWRRLKVVVKQRYGGASRFREAGSLA